jgi:predicted enzyme related to lactoylglutathione lyase
MKARISQMTLVVNDQQAALDFYTKKVGFDKKTDFTPPGGYRWVTVGPKEQDLELALFQAGTNDANGWSSQWRPGNNPPIVVNVDDCRAAFAELKSRGVEFKQAHPEVYAWGVSATFSDPDGNLFSINQRPTPPSSAQSWGK